MATRAPYRADEVGSLLRPAELKEARAARAEGRIGADELRAVEDRAIRDVVQQAGGGRAEGRDRRRIPPLLVAFRFPRRARGRRGGGGRARHPVPGRADQGADAQGVRQGRFRRPSDARPFPLPEGGGDGHAEDDDPLPFGAAFPRRPAVDQQGRLSGHGFLLRRHGGGLPQGRAAPSTTPAAAICSSTTRCGPISARRRSGRPCATAARIPTRCPASTAT